MANTFWVFGYGSLMWDTWNKDVPCLQQTVATLAGYGRVFNKKSTYNWGTEAHPCPTLNLQIAAGHDLQGLAFEFSNADREHVGIILKKREGDGFEFPEFEIVLRSGMQVHAIVPNYVGSDLLSVTNENEIVDAIGKAAGKNGTGREYVLGLAAQLEQLGISDSTVTALKTQLQKH